MLWILAVALAFAGADSEVGAHTADASVHYVDTADGYQVAVQRHAGAGEPVVLVHGISSNHHFWDLDPERSLAVYLQQHGYDVYNVDLRGHGLARREEDGDKQHAGWTVDEYGLQDLPAVFDFVRSTSGVERVHYVGHSMGGTVLAVYLAHHADPPLASAVLVASPVELRDPPKLMRLALGQSWIARVTPFLPTPMYARMLARWDEKAPLQADQILYNPANIAPDARERMLRTVVSPLSRGEVKQFAQARHDGEIRSKDGQIPYRTSLGHVQVPMLFFAGRVDHIVSPDRVRAYYDAVGSPEKELVMASVANGFTADYGHLGFGVGDHAAEEVFPRIAAWLEAH